MIDQETSERVIEARSCNNCLDWHKHCNAECCKMLTINGPASLLDGGKKYITIKLPEPLDSSDQLYYKLRDVDYTRGSLRILKSRCFVVGNKIIYMHPCKLLNDNKCAGHPNNKPELCRSLTLEASNLPGQKFLLTKNCLFKYK